ncbi:MAG: type II toxin-antitoxin system RelE/ParE family toxin [Planctomycetes bacterium]|nr:type II toxin-antitoxin system RelE/ParE family toxin [Planctomycetota bacterium]MBU4399237.1 type II toxin-antitoxin system RelE/ParE family toxin [Planctomycetota bacterium]MCG2683550.1 type II toxin-antitoxin system RelE/ParE family toxin [Planctomycetales bacterium]
MSRFTLAPEVRRDLDAIWDYIGVEKCSPAAAQHVVERLFEAFSSLATQPLLGEQREDLGANIRAFVVRPYVVLYRPLADGAQIAQVVHSARDIQVIARTKKA